jgi:hypothetical protein
MLGANERDTSLWIWRVSFLSNLTASSINVFYATSEHMTDLYPLHLANTVVNFIWWIFFFVTLWKSPGFVVDTVRATPTSSSSGKGKSFSSGVNSPTRPGDTAPPANSYDAALEMIGRGDYADLMDHPNVPNVCHTCRVVKPLRSKHCKIARRCVLKFDHFW